MCTRSQSSPRFHTPLWLLQNLHTCPDQGPFVTPPHPSLPPSPFPAAYCSDSGPACRKGHCPLSSRASPTTFSPVPRIPATSNTSAPSWSWRLGLPITWLHPICENKSLPPPSNTPLLTARMAAPSSLLYFMSCSNLAQTPSLQTQLNLFLLPFSPQPLLLPVSQPHLCCVPPGSQLHPSALARL